MESNAVTVCKMRVAQVTQTMDADGKPESEQVKLQAVYGREGTRNAEWSKYTPSADFNINISNPAAFGKLSRGQFFLVSFTPAGLDD